MSTDVTLVVTAHDETAHCGPTLRAADAAARTARSRGLVVEQVVALVDPTEATSRYFDQPRLEHWQRTALEPPEQSAPLESLLDRASGRFLTFLTADTLVSENWLVAALETIAEGGPRVVAQPELSVTFDGRKSVQVNLDSDSRLLPPHHLYVAPVYGGTCLAPAEAYRQSPGARDLVASRAPVRARRFIVETLSAGWRHAVARDTAVFERDRDFPGGPPDPSWPGEPERLGPLRIDRVSRPAPRAQTPE